MDRITLSLIGCLIGFGVYADNQNELSAYFELSGIQTIGVEHDSSLSYDLFLPLFAQNGKVIFFNPRLYDRAGSSLEGNFHLGYRCLVGTNQLLGVYSAFDARRSPYRNHYNQVTFGAEYWYKNLFLGGNYYLPIGQKVKYTNYQRSNTVNSVFDYKSGILNDVNDLQYAQETALGGEDFTLGYAMTDQMTGFVGGYYFENKLGRNIVGYEIRAEYQYFQDQKRVLGILNDVKLTVSLKQDYRGLQALCGISIKMWPGVMKKQTTWQRRLARLPKRDPDIQVHSQIYRERVVVGRRPIQARDLINEQTNIENLINAYQDSVTKIMSQEISQVQKRGYINLIEQQVKDNFDKLYNVLPDHDKKQAYRQFILLHHPDKYSGINREINNVTFATFRNLFKDNDQQPNNKVNLNNAQEQLNFTVSNSFENSKNLGLVKQDLSVEQKNKIQPSLLKTEQEKGNSTSLQVTNLDELRSFPSSKYEKVALSSFIIADTAVGAINLFKILKPNLSTRDQNEQDQEEDNDNNDGDDHRPPFPFDRGNFPPYNNLFQEGNNQEETEHDHPVVAPEHMFEVLNNNVTLVNRTVATERALVVPEENNIEAVDNVALLGRRNDLTTLFRNHPRFANVVGNQRNLQYLINHDEVFRQAINDDEFRSIFENHELTQAIIFFPEGVNYRRNIVIENINAVVPMLQNNADFRSLFLRGNYTDFTFYQFMNNVVLDNISVDGYVYFGAIVNQLMMNQILNDADFREMVIQNTGFRQLLINANVDFRQLICEQANIRGRILTDYHFRDLLIRELEQIQLMPANDFIEIMNDHQLFDLFNRYYAFRLSMYQSVARPVILQHRYYIIQHLEEMPEVLRLIADYPDFMAIVLTNSDFTRLITNRNFFNLINESDSFRRLIFTYPSFLSLLNTRPAFQEIIYGQDNVVREFVRDYYNLLERIHHSGIFELLLHNEYFRYYVKYYFPFRRNFFNPNFIENVLIQNENLIRSIIEGNAFDVILNIDRLLDNTVEANTVNNRMMALNDVDFIRLLVNEHPIFSITILNNVALQQILCEENDIRRLISTNMDLMNLIVCDVNFRTCFIGENSFRNLFLHGNLSELILRDNRFRLLNMHNPQVRELMLNNADLRLVLTEDPFFRDLFIEHFYSVNNDLISFIITENNEFSRLILRQNNLRNLILINEDFRNQFLLNYLNGDLLTLLVWYGQFGEIIVRNGNVHNSLLRLSLDSNWFVEQENQQIAPLASRLLLPAAFDNEVTMNNDLNRVEVNEDEVGEEPVINNTVSLYNHPDRNENVVIIQGFGDNLLENLDIRNIRRFLKELFRRSRHPLFTFSF